MFGSMFYVCLFYFVIQLLHFFCIVKLSLRFFYFFLFSFITTCFLILSNGFLMLTLFNLIDEPMMSLVGFLYVNRWDVPC